MAAPLAPAATTTPAPAPAPTPVQEAPVAAQAEEAPAASSERTLFEDFDVQAEPAAREPAPAPQAATSDLPPPAYAPRPEPTLTDADSFVAPRAPAPGTPSPEALARLQAAVSRVPARNTQPQAGTPAAAPSEADKPRFGINSLINRMTGAQAESGGQHAGRAQPQVTALRQEPEQHEDQDKIEIPAFLRRQAN